MRTIVFTIIVAAFAAIIINGCSQESPTAPPQSQATINPDDEYAAHTFSSCPGTSHTRRTV